MIYLSPDLQGRISLKESINLKREEDIDRPLLLTLLPDQTLWILLGERKIQRDLSTLIKREEDDRWRLLLHQIPPNLNLTLVDIQGLINLPRLFKRQLQYNLRRLILVKSQINLLIKIRFSRISLNRIRSQIRKLNPKSGHLIVRLTRSSGFFLLSYAPKLSRIKLH